MPGWDFPCASRDPARRTLPRLYSGLPGEAPACRLASSAWPVCGARPRRPPRMRLGCRCPRLAVCSWPRSCRIPTPPAAWRILHPFYLGPGRAFPQGESRLGTLRVRAAAADPVAGFFGDQRIEPALPSASLGPRRRRAPLQALEADGPARAVAVFHGPSPGVRRPASSLRRAGPVPHPRPSSRWSR